MRQRSDIKKLDSKGQDEIYKIARVRAGRGKDLGEVSATKDEEGRALYKSEEINERWKENFSILVNTEN